MAINFPATAGQPTDGSFTHYEAGVAYSWNGTSWVADAGNISPGVDLTAFSVTTNAAGSPALSYNNATGVFSYTPPDLSNYLTSYTVTESDLGTISIDALSDVDTTTTAPTSGQVLKYDGTNWIPGDDVIGSGGGQTPASHAVGQALYEFPGTYNWTCPANCTSVSVVCVGGGGGGTGTPGYGQNGGLSSLDTGRYGDHRSGGGGGLGWKNNISVTPGQTYKVVVGARGDGDFAGGQDGGTSYFIDKSTCSGGGGFGGNRSKYHQIGLDSWHRIHWSPILFTQAQDDPTGAQQQPTWMSSYYQKVSYTNSSNQPATLTEVATGGHAPFTQQTADGVTIQNAIRSALGNSNAGTTAISAPTPFTIVPSDGETYSIDGVAYPIMGRLYVPTGLAASSIDVVVAFHGTLDDDIPNPSQEQDDIGDAATTTLLTLTDQNTVNLRDKIIFSVAYPQDHITNVRQYNLSGVGTEQADFLLGDNLPYAQAAVKWVENSLDTYMAAQGISKTRDNIYLFGHSQGGSLVTKINTIYAGGLISGVVANAPGPIRLDLTCSSNPSNPSCSKIAAIYGATPHAGGIYTGDGGGRGGNFITYGGGGGAGGYTGDGNSGTGGAASSGESNGLTGGGSGGGGVGLLGEGPSGQVLSFNNSQGSPMLGGIGGSGGGSGQSGTVPTLDSNNNYVNGSFGTAGGGFGGGGGGGVRESYGTSGEANGSGGGVRIIWGDGRAFPSTSTSDQTTDPGTPGTVSQNSFETIVVSGQSDVVADQSSDTLTFVAGTNINITTDASNDSITFNSIANITDSAQGVNVTGKVATTGGMDIDIGGQLNAAGTTIDFQNATISFTGASIGGLGSTIRDTVDLHLNQTDGTNVLPNNGEVLSWNSTGGGAGTGDYEWVSQSSPGLSAVQQDTAPQLGGNLDLNSKDITGSGNIDITGDITSSGTITDSQGPIRRLGISNQASDYTLTSSDSGKSIVFTNNGGTITVPATGFVAGDVVTILNHTGTDITIASDSGLTLYNTADGTTGNKTAAQRSSSTVVFISSSIAYISGTGLS